MTGGWSLLALAMAISAEPSVRHIGGWVAGCNNYHICTAVLPIERTRLSQDGSSSPFLHIIYFPRIEQNPKISIVDPANPSKTASLKPPVAMLVVESRKRKADPDGGVFYAHADGRGGYEFRDEDSFAILDDLRRGDPIYLSINEKSDFPLDTRQLDDVLGIFHRTYLRPTDPEWYPPYPKDGIVRLSTFDAKQSDAWLRRMLNANAGIKIKWEAFPKWGFVTAVRYKSFAFDCGVYDRWGHVGKGKFVLIERSEMPVCQGVKESHWIETYAAHTRNPGEN